MYCFKKKLNKLPLNIFVKILILVSSISLFACKSGKKQAFDVETGAAESSEVNRANHIEGDNASALFRRNDHESGTLSEGRSRAYDIDVIPGLQKISIELDGYGGSFRVRLLNNKWRLIQRETSHNKIEVEIDGTGRHRIQVVLDYAYYGSFFGQDNSASYTLKWHFSESTNDIRFNSAIFDHNYYLAQNPEIVAAGFADEIAARQHWDAHGFAEGRVGSPHFHAPSYLERYSDLQARYGNNYEGAAEHFVAIGQAEGRNATASEIEVDQATNHLLDALVFDADYYLSIYPDLVNAGIQTTEAAESHWLNHGITEGRIGSPDFHAPTYLARYADLQAVFGNDLKQATEHFVLNGYQEGRIGN